VARQIMTHSLSSGDKQLVLEPPVIMGILNVTPDSFSDGGQHLLAENAISAGNRMLAEGASIIDVGGESTRPGAAPVTVDEELERVLPVVEALVSTGARVSVDTSHPEVMRLTVEAGAFMINDIRALQRPGAVEMVAALGVPVCLMHMLGEPGTMQADPQYEHVVEEVVEFLRRRIAACTDGGIAPEKIVIDPGFGFGKTLEHNLCLLRELAAFSVLNCPVLAGLSRKSLFGAILGTEVDDRLHASVAGALLAVERGASIVRVHDVRETAHALAVRAAMVSGN